MEEEQTNNAILNYKTQCVKKMRAIVEELFSILDNHVKKLSLTEEDLVFIAKTKADYSRYMAEVDSDNVHKENSAKH